MREERFICNIKAGFYYLGGIPIYVLALGLRHLCPKGRCRSSSSCCSRGGLKPDLSLVATEQLVRPCAHMCSHCRRRWQPGLCLVLPETGALLGCASGILVTWPGRPCCCLPDFIQDGSCTAQDTNMWPGVGCVAPPVQR